MENERKRINFEELKPCIVDPIQKKDWIWLPSEEGRLQEYAITYDPKAYIETINRISVELGAEVTTHATLEEWINPLQVYKKHFLVNIGNDIKTRYGYEYVRRILTEPCYWDLDDYPGGAYEDYPEGTYLTGSYYEFSKEDPIVQGFIAVEEPIKYQTWDSYLQSFSNPYELCDTKDYYKKPKSEREKVQMAYDFFYNIPDPFRDNLERNLLVEEGHLFLGNCKEKKEFDCGLSFWLLGSYLQKNKKRLQDKNVLKALRQYLGLFEITEHPKGIHNGDKLILDENKIYEGNYDYLSCVANYNRHVLALRKRSMWYLPKGKDWR